MQERQAIDAAYQLATRRNTLELPTSCGVAVAVCRPAGHSLSKNFQGISKNPKLTRPPWTTPLIAELGPSQSGFGGTGIGSSSRRGRDLLQTQWYGHIVYATRTSDGGQVCIKRVVTGSSESRIARMLSAPPLRDDPAIHAVPILDVFQDEENGYITYLVMPLLRHIDDPPIEAVGDVVDFVDQLLEGLAFLHKNGVAHRDCSYANLMMSTKIEKLGRGIHFWGRPGDALSGSQRTYYFIDFGLSVHVENPNCRVLVLGNEGHDRAPPELRTGNRIPYDPYKLDVFLVGNVFRRLLLDRYLGLASLVPLADAMTRTDPAERPSAVEALDVWRQIRSQTGTAPWRRQLQMRGNHIQRAALKLSLFVCFVLLCVRIQTG
ncbi:kinase-like domain-containing protein [Fomitopsis betulina]|nr:kinase-like domain-containing protein [Fomitopsis betulina]